MRDNLDHNEMFRDMPAEVFNKLKKLFHYDNMRPKSHGNKNTKEKHPKKQKTDKNNKKENIEKNDNEERTETWNSLPMRRTACVMGSELCAGKEYTVDFKKQKSKINFRENSALTDQHWQQIWSLAKTDKVFDFDNTFLEKFPDRGDVALQCIDILLGVIAHYLQSNILVFDAPSKNVQFINGNAFLNGNVNNNVPFLLGHSRGHYQVLVPDVKKVPNANDIILNYSLQSSDDCQIAQAKEYSRMENPSLIPSSDSTSIKGNIGFSLTSHILILLTISRSVNQRC